MTQTYTFNPCSSPIKLTVLVTTDGQSQPIISEVLTTSKVKSTELGTFSVHRENTEAGVNFGVSKYILQFDLHVLNPIFHCKCKCYALLSMLSSH